MGTFKDREDYLKQLCIDHPIVAHGGYRSHTNLTLRNSYARYNNEEELFAATRNNIDYPCVCNIQIEAKLTDKDKALVDMRWVWHNGWIFLQHVSEPVTNATSSDEIQDAYDTTFTVMEDFIKSMKEDWEQNEKCGAFDQVDFNQFNASPIGPTEQNEYGWTLYFDNEQKATRITS